MSTTTYGSISQRTAAYAAAKMLSHAEPVLVLQKFGTPKPLPKNKANTVKFRRPVPFANATTPLTEGVTPVAHQIQYEDVSAVLAQYGDVVEITDVVQDLAEDSVLSDASMLSGEQAGATLEAITWGVIRAGTNVLYANGTARGNVNTAVSLNKIRAAVRFLKAQKARAITQILSPSVNYETQAVEGGFVGVAHTDMEADLRNLTGFVPVAKYGSRKTLCPDEIGTVENVRFVLSPDLDAFTGAGSLTLNGMVNDGTNVNVYPLILMGKEFFGCVPLKGREAITPMVLNPNTPRGGDPLGQRGTVGWKSYYACVVLNQAWGIRIEAGVTDL